MPLYQPPPHPNWFSRSRVSVSLPYGPSSSQRPCLCLPSLPLGGPLSPTPSLLARVKRKGISFAIYPQNSLQKELKDTLQSVRKTRPKLAKRAQVVILIMWNSPLFMENFLLQHLWPLKEPSLFSTPESQGSPSSWGLLPVQVIIPAALPLCLPHPFPAQPCLPQTSSGCKAAVLPGLPPPLNSPGPPLPPALMASFFGSGLSQSLSCPFIPVCDSSLCRQTPH